MDKKQQGFTLIELMIVIAIVGVLSAIAVPMYSDYTSRTRAANTLREMKAIKRAVDICIANRGKKAGCNTGAESIRAAIITDNLLSLTVVDAVLTGSSGATDTSGNNLNFVLKPNIASGGNMDWEMTGTLCNKKRGLRPGQGGCK